MRSGFWRCHDNGTQAGIGCLGRRMKDEEGKKGRMKSGQVGRRVTTAYPRRRRPICPGPRSPPTTTGNSARGGSGAFEPCMLIMRTERGVGLCPLEKGTGVCCWWSSPALTAPPTRRDLHHRRSQTSLRGGLHLGQKMGGAWEARRDSPRSR